MTADMYYLLQLLYFNDYTYETLIERHTQHNDKPIEDDATIATMVKRSRSRTR